MAHLGLEAAAREAGITKGEGTPGRFSLKYGAQASFDEGSKGGASFVCVPLGRLEQGVGDLQGGFHKGAHNIRPIFPYPVAGRGGYSRDRGSGRALPCQHGGGGAMRRTVLEGVALRLSRAAAPASPMIPAVFDASASPEGPP
jgi:hypothetical protein